MKKALLPILCVVGVVAAFLWSFTGGERVVEPGLEPPSPTESSPDDAEAAEELAVLDAAATRTAASDEALEQDPQEAPAETASASDPTGEPWTAKGIVLDTAGEPLAGADIVRSMGLVVLAVTGGAGTFEVPMKDSSAAFRARREGYRTVFAGVANRHLDDEEAVVMVARVVALGGVVVSQDGAPIAKASLSMSVPWRGMAGFPRSLERSSGVGLNWKGKADGTFEMRDVPIIEGAPLSVVADGFQTASVLVPKADDFSLVIELLPENAAAPPQGSDDSIFFGVALDEGGQVVEGAEVFLGDARATSDASGRWELVRGRGIPVGTPLAAAHPVAGTAFLPFDEAWNEKGARVGPLEMSLRPNSLSIQGRVVDSAGDPLVGWTVELLDPTVLDHFDMDSPSLESKGVGRSTSDRSKGDGSFRINGLLDRSYDLRAYSQRSFLSITRPGVPGGTNDLELRLPVDAAIEALRVRVLTRDGQAVAGASVAARFILERSRNGFTSQDGASGITDDEGVAVLNEVPRRGVDLVVQRPGVVTATLSPDEAGLPDGEVEIRVDRNLEVVIDCSRLSPIPETVRILDGEGKQLMISSRTSRGSTSSTSLRLNGGLSAVVSVSEAAAELQILKNWEEVRRVPIQLAPDTTNRIEVP